MKKSKRIFALTIAVITAVSSIPVTLLAKTPGDLESAILSVKNRIEISSEYSEFYSDISADENGTAYDLHWNTPYDDYADYKNIDVTVNDRDDVMFFAKSTEEDGMPGFSLFSDAELKGKAIEWIKSVNPSWIAQLPTEEAEVSNYGVYNNKGRVVFKRYINGLEFCGEQVQISVNNRTGETVRMNCYEWSYPQSVPSADGVISAEEAERIFYENSPMILEYIKPADANTAIPIYKPQDRLYKINASDGSRFEEFSYDFDADKNAYDTEKMSAETSAGGSGGAYLTEAENESIAETAGLLTAEELCKIAESLKNTGIADATFKKYTYNRKKSKDDADSAEYSARLEYVGGEYRFIVNLDAYTGELQSLYSYSVSPEKFDTEKTAAAPSVSANALEFVDSFSGCADKLRVREDDNTTEYGTCTYITYDRIENDLPYKANYVTVGVDKESGLIRSYNKYWDNEVEFASTDGIISAQEAMKIFNNNVGLRLSYEKKQGESKDTPQIGLMYSLKDSEVYAVDAKSGEVLGYNGKPYLGDYSAKVYPIDIAGHYAESAIKKLMDANVLTLPADEEAFRPDDNITMKELLMFSVGLRDGYIPYAADSEYTRWALRNAGLSADTDLNSAAKRKDGAKIVISMLGYKSLAELEGIYNTDFADGADIKQEYLGYIALAKGMQIVNGDDEGRFNPEMPLTRADAALMLYNYFNNPK